MDNKIILTIKERKEILKQTEKFAVVVDELPVELDQKKKYILDFMRDFTKEFIDTRKPID